MSQDSQIKCTCTRHKYGESRVNILYIDEVLVTCSRHSSSEEGHLTGLTWMLSETARHLGTAEAREREY